MAQSVVAIENSHCISVEGKDSHNECPGYDTKQSDVEVPEMLWGIRCTPLLPESTLDRNDSN